MTGIFMHLLFIGTGYVGLVTGASMAEMGHTITCLDIDAKKVELLNQGHIPIYEQGLEELVRRNKKAGRLRFTTSYQEGVKASQVCFICVDTPPDSFGRADLTQVKNVARSIAQEMDRHYIIINKSTVPVGTAHVVRQEIQEVLDARQRSPLAFDVVSNPEFLAEGSAVMNCMKPDRVILGVDNPEIEPILKEIYSPFMLNHDRLILMDVASAEMTKYAANTMLASRISLMNELAGLCEKVGANIDLVRVGIGADQRIGYKFLYPGMGYGGSCLPKDLKALKALADQVDHPTPMLSAIEEVNEKQKHLMAEKICAYYEKRGAVSGKTIGILGLSFKPETNDMREAPSLVLIRCLLNAGVNLRLYDPVAMPDARKLLPDHDLISWCDSEYEAATGADALVLVTEWKQFRFLDFSKIKMSMQGNAFFDGRNQYIPKKMIQQGFDYISIGKPEALAYSQHDFLMAAHDAQHSNDEY